VDVDLCKRYIEVWLFSLSLSCEEGGKRYYSDELIKKKKHRDLG